MEDRKNLNTSYVKVKQGRTLNNADYGTNLNTSYVKVKLKWLYLAFKQ